MQVMVTVLFAPSCEVVTAVDRERMLLVTNLHKVLRCDLTSGDPGNVTFSWAQLIPGRPATDSLYTSEDTDSLYSPLDLLVTRVAGDHSLLEAPLTYDTTYRWALYTCTLVILVTQLSYFSDTSLFQVSGAE